jgi:hypothetical protein
MPLQSTGVLYGSNLFKQSYQIDKRCFIDNLSTFSKKNFGAGYSIRLLYSSYSGPMINVQRSSDNATQDFYGDENGNLSTIINANTINGISLTTWLNGSVGIIKILYDQSGNGRHLNQAYNNTYITPSPIKEMLSAPTSAKGLFALNRVSYAYTGPTLTLRRSSDNNVQDFYADVLGNLGSNVNATGTNFTTWVSGTNAYIVIWWDQSGNTNHAIQFTTTLQPYFNYTLNWIDFSNVTNSHLISATLSTNYTYGNGTLTFTGTGSIGIPIGSNLPYSFNFKHGNISTNGYVLSSNITSTSGNVVYYNSNSYYANDFANTTSANTLISQNGISNYNTQAIITNDGSTRKIYVNGILNNTSGSISYTVPTGTQYLGRNSTGTSFINSTLYHLYIFNTALSDADRIITTSYDITTIGYNIHYLGGNSIYTNNNPAVNICEYPPNNLITSNTTTVSGQFSAYNGTYTITASTSSNSPFNAFQENTTSYWESAANYSLTSGNYVGTTTQTTDVNSNVYTGDYLQIQLPTSILLKCFSISGRQDVNLNLYRSPRNFTVLGSNNGTNWTLLHSESSLITWNYADKIFYCNVSNTISFSYYRIVVMEICNSYSGNATYSNYADISRWKLNPATPIPRGSPNYSFLTNYTPMNSTLSSGYQWISGQGNNSSSQFGGLSINNLTIGMPGNSNDIMFIPIVNNISRKSILSVNNNLTNNITIYDNNNNWQNTSPTVSNLTIGNLSLTIGCNPVNSGFQNFQGIINEVIILTNTISINDANLYTISSSTITQLNENPIPKTIVRFNNKDTQVLPGYTPVVMLDLGILQNTNPFNSYYNGQNPATQFKYWNDFTASGSFLYYPSNGYTDFNAPGSNGIGGTGYWNNMGYAQSDGSTGLLNGGSKTFNLSTNGGFTAICIIYSNSSNTNERVFDFGDSTYTNNIIAWKSAGTTTMSFGIWDNTGTNLSQITTPTGTYNTGEWGIWTFRYTNSTKFYEIFKNGQQIASGTSATAAANRTVTNTYINYNQAIPVYSNTAINGIACYDYSLSNTDIGTIIQFLLYPISLTNGPLSIIPDSNNITRVGQVYNVPSMFNTAVKFYGTGYYDMTDVPDLNMSFSIRFCIHRNLSSTPTAQSSLWTISSNTTLTLTTVSSNYFYVGMTLMGTGITGPCSIIAITSNISGGSGTVCTLSTSQTNVTGSTNILTGIFTTMTIISLCDQSRNGNGLNIDYDIPNSRLVINSLMGSNLISYINGLYTNVWFNMTVICTSSFQILVYLNGILQITQTGTANMTARSRFILGDSGNTSLVQPYFGYLKDFKIYDYVLRSDQIYQLYQVPYSPKLLTYNSSSNLINRGNWYNIMMYSGLLSKTDPNTQVQTGSFLTGGGNIWQYNRIHDYQSFRCSFDLLANNTGADTIHFHCGTSGPVGRADFSTGNSMVINFELFGGNTGIWLKINNNIVKYSYTLEYRQNEWTNVVVTYNRSNINTWVITVNGIDIIKYDMKNNDYWRINTSGSCWGLGSSTGGSTHNSYFRNIELDYIPYIDSTISSNGSGNTIGTGASGSGYSLGKLIKGGYSSSSIGNCRGAQRGLMDGLTWKLYDGFCGTSNYTTPRPLLYLDFNILASYPGTGTTVYDLSGNGYNYTLTNSPTYSGGYLTFNSVSSQYLNSPSFGTLTTKSITIEIWLSPSGVGIVIDEVGQSGGYHATIIEINTSQISARIFNIGTLNLGPWVSGNWYHIVLTYDGNTQIGYVNGILIASSTGTRTSPTSTDQYHFGYTDSTNMGTSSYFNGTLGQMKIYNSALNANQVLQNYNKLTTPINIPISITTTGASGSGSIATLTFTTQTIIPYLKGSYITVSGVTPTGYNGTFIVTSSTVTSVSFSNTTTGSQTVAGTITNINYNYNYINTNYFLLNKYQAIGRTSDLTNLQTITQGQISKFTNTYNSSSYLFQSLSSNGQATARSMYDLFLLNSSYSGAIIKLRNNANLVFQDFYSDINGNWNTLANGSGSTFSSWYNTNCLGNYTVPSKISTWTVGSSSTPYTWTTDIYKTTNTTLNGTYTITSSSEYNRSDLYAYHLFDNITAGVPNLWHISSPTYDGTTGAYTGSTSTTVSSVVYLGEWVQVQVPNAINITSFTIYGITDPSSYKRSPTQFVFAGSSNGTTWTAINISTISTATTWTVTIPQTFSGNTSTYTYFRLITTHIVGGYDGYLNIARLVLNTNISGATEPSPVYVNTWYDQSGNAINATQPIFGYQPIYNNISNCLEFTTVGGSISYLNMGSSGNSTSPIQTGNPYYTYVIKHGNVNISNGCQFISAGIKNTNNNDASFYVNSNGYYYDNWWNNDARYPGEYYSGNIVTIGYDGTNRYGYINGVLGRSGASSSHSIPSGQQYIGIYNDAISQPLDGQLSSVYIFSSTSNSGAYLTNSDRILCENVQNNSFNFSLELTGYFLASTSDTYTFSINSVDDAAYGWIGTNANSGYTTSNSNFNGITNNDILVTNAGSVLLTAGVYYPFRLMYTQNIGTNNLNLTFTRSTALINRLSSSAQNAVRGLYALFLVRSGYSGFIIRLISNIGSVTQDFYATTYGLLTTGTAGSGTNYNTWLTQNNSTFAYVSIWYDQSSNGFNATQNTTSLQPIYNGNNYIDFGIQINSYLNMGSGTSATSPFINGTNLPFTTVVKHTTINTNFSNNGFLGAGTPATANAGINLRTNSTGNGSSYDLYFNNDDTIFGTYNSPNTITFTFDGTNKTVYTNNLSNTITHTGGTGGYVLSGSQQQYIGKTIDNAYLNGQMNSLFIFNTVLSNSDISIVNDQNINDFTGYFYSSLGSNSNYPAESAKVIKDLCGTNIDDSYYINVNGTSTPIYCLMNDIYEGGGWMMLMKGIRGNTFNYGSNYWVDPTSTLKSTDVSRLAADAKYNTFNYSYIGDVMSIFPDISSNSYTNVFGKNGGSLNLPDGWCWKVNNWNNNAPLLQQLSSSGQSSARGLYSLLRVNVNYTGPTIQLRNNANTVTQNFYASVTGQLGTTWDAGGIPYSTWYTTNGGSSNVYVTIWYDQSGNGFHATQSTTTLQPGFTYVAVGGGSIFSSYLDFSIQTNSYLNMGTSSSGPFKVGTNLPFTITFKHGTLTNITSNGILGAGNSSGSNNTQINLRMNNSSGNDYNLYFFNDDTSFGTYASGNIVTVKYNGSSNQGYVNNSSNTSTRSGGTQIGYTLPSNFQQYIGKTTLNQTMNGQMYNLYIFSSALSDNDRTVMENKGTNYAVQTAFASNYIQSKCTGLSGFQISRDAGNCANPFTFPGYSTNLFSYETGAYKHCFGSGIHVYYGSTNSYIRWGVLTNNEGDFATVDAMSGIGFNKNNGATTYSAGDLYGGVGTSNLNRSFRFEMYGR